SVKRRVHSSGGAGDGLCWAVLGVLVGFGIELREAAATALYVRSCIEPENAVFIAGNAVRASSYASLVVELEIFNRAGLAINAGDRSFETGVRKGDPDVPVKVHLRIMDTGDMVHTGLCAEGPVAAVHRRCMTVLHREVIFLDHCTRRFAGGTRAKLEFHRAFAWAARPSEIGRQFLLVKVDIGRRLVIRAEVDAEHV